MRAQTAISLYFPFVALLADLAAAATLWVGAERVTAGALTAGTLLAFVLYVDNFFTPIQQLSQVFDAWQQTRVSVSRISGLMKLETLTPAPEHPVAVRRLTGDNGTHVVAYGTEAGLFQRAGWSTVVCGPGDIAQAHQPDEYIEISELEAGERLLRRVIAELTA